MFANTIRSSSSLRVLTRRQQWGGSTMVGWNQLSAQQDRLHHSQQQQQQQHYFHTNFTGILPTSTPFRNDMLGSINLRSFATTTKGGTSQSKEQQEPSSQKQQQNQGFLQNQEWVKFQQSIQVDGFQTGQMTTVTNRLKKSKGGKQSRNRKAKELALQQQQDQLSGAANIATSDNRFPAIRYSPQETQELLKLAYETLPERMGKRGTRNLKRQNQRWKTVRQIRNKYKQQIIAAHERKMEHRQWTRAKTKSMKEDAPTICLKDMEYQASILKRWATTMYPSPGTPTESVVTASS